MVDPYSVAQDALKLVQLIVRKCDEVKALKTELTPLKDNLRSLGGILQDVGEVDYKTIPPLSTILRPMLRLSSVLILDAVNDQGPLPSQPICEQRAHWS